MKLLASILFIFGLYIHAAGFNENMDKKIYYDADRTQQESFEDMSKELNLFIKDEANEELVRSYVDGKVVLSDEEQELLLEEQDETASNNQEQIEETNTAQTTLDQEESQDEELEQKDTSPGFFAKLLESVGIGSTKTIQTQDSTEELEESQIEDTQEEVQDEVQEDTQDETQEQIDQNLEDTQNQIEEVQNDEQ